MVSNERWDSLIQELGEVPERSAIKVQFYYKGECIPQQLVMKPSCGCTEINWVPQDRILRVTLRTAKIPKHLNTNKWGILKSVKMEYLCNGEKIVDVLKIGATIIK